jgi:hypothetical protein
MAVLTAIVSLGCDHVRVGYVGDGGAEDQGQSYTCPHALLCHLVLKCGPRPAASVSKILRPNIWCL